MLIELYIYLSSPSTLTDPKQMHLHHTRLHRVTRKVILFDPTRQNFPMQQRHNLVWFRN